MEIPPIRRAALAPAPDPSAPGPPAPDPPDPAQLEVAERRELAFPRAPGEIAPGRGATPCTPRGADPPASEDPDDASVGAPAATGAGMALQPARKPDPVRGFLELCVLAALVHGALRWTLAGLPAVEGEALALRWLRALAEHPWRGALGLALVARALQALARALAPGASRT